MQLKVNSMYQTDTGWIIPRSHLSEGKGEKYLIVEVLTGGVEHFVKSHTSYTTKELRKVLHIGAKERLDVL